MDNLDVAYHEAAHAVMAYLYQNLNYGLSLHDDEYTRGLSLQKFRIQKYLVQNPIVVRGNIKNIPTEIELIDEQIKGIIITLHAGEIAQNIFKGLPPKLIPDYREGSDDRTFGEILTWYCDYASLILDASKMYRCFHDINSALYEEMKENSSVWLLISKLAHKLYHAKNQRLNAFQTNRLIFWHQLKQAFRGTNKPSFDLDILAIIKKHCL